MDSQDAETSTVQQFELWCLCYRKERASAGLGAKERKEGCGISGAINKEHQLMDARGPNTQAGTKHPRTHHAG